MAKFNQVRRGENLFESKSPLAMVITIDLSDQSINEDQTPI
jgi:hypothetical protein